MIADATEEMHGSDRVPDLKTITSEPWLVWQFLTRAKWRAPRSARTSTLEECLTPPALSETRFSVN